MSKRIRFPFAENGQRTAIQDVTQPSGIVNYQDGYPAAYSLDIVTDPTARRVNRDRFNQLMFDITSNIKEWQEQSFPAYIQPSSNGGVNYAYPKGMTVRFNGGYRISLVDNNDTQPDNASNWADAFPLPVALGGTGVATINEQKTQLGVAPQATQQEALDGADVNAYMPPDLVHASFNQYGIGAPVIYQSLNEDDAIDPRRVYYIGLSGIGAANVFSFGGEGSENLRTSQLIIEKDTDRAYIRRHNSEESPATKPKVKLILETDKATTADVQAGTDDEKYVTPLGLASSIVGSPNQTWQDVTSLRTAGVTYTNTTGGPIMFKISLVNITTVEGSVTIDGFTETLRGIYTTSESAFANASFIVPDGSEYSYTGPASLILELRP
jgi:hypothetical protein